MKQVTCLKCGYVHMGIIRAEAEANVVQFNAYYYAMSETDRSAYGGPSTIRQYEECHRCGNSYKNFRPTRAGDAPDGVTIAPIIVENQSSV